MYEDRSFILPIRRGLGLADAIESAFNVVTHELSHRLPSYALLWVFRDDVKTCVEIRLKIDAQKKQ